MVSKVTPIIKLKCTVLSIVLSCTQSTGIMGTLTKGKSTGTSEFKVHVCDNLVSQFFE